VSTDAASPASFAAPSQRRVDLDWIRVGAFGLLILYHVGMFYVPWDWHVKSGHQVEWLEPVMQLTNPWRLTLLFLVSGAATRFMADRLSASRLAGSRTLRLLPPLLFGMFAVVPPQSFYEVYEALIGLGVSDPGHSPWLADFWTKYATASGGWCDADGCLVTPTWNHLWFVAYLWVYSGVLALLLALTSGRLRRIGGWLERLLDGWGLLVWPIVFLAAIRWLLAARFEITHALVDDWYNHALSFSAFLFGFLTARSESLRQGFIRLRRPALLLAFASWALWAGYAWVYRADDAVPAEVLRTVMRGVYAIDQWAFIACILGYGARYLTRATPLLRYLSIGVFPFYIAHQTIIVTAGHHLAKLGLPLGTEAGLIIAITALGCWLTYEIARRIGWFGLLLGVRPKPRPLRPALMEVEAT
jgi:glucans biosynthesis protein C